MLRIRQGQSFGSCYAERWRLRFLNMHEAKVGENPLFFLISFEILENRLQ